MRFSIPPLFAALALTPLQVLALNPCASFQNTTLSLSQIRFTSTIPAGSNFTGDSPEPSFNALQTNIPEVCRVAGVVQTSGNSSARFEVWLPVDGEWNGRFLAVGNGGWAGGVNYVDIVWGAKMGFATMSTDTGHNATSGDATWTGNAEQMIDFGHRALHLTTLAAKQITSTYYSLPPSYSYYTGCSAGGRQGLNEIQRYPSDFNGVLIGAPANPMTHLVAWGIRVALEQFPNTKEGYIEDSTWAVVHEKVLEVCDRADGVVDGLVSDPRACVFRPEVLACGMEGVGGNGTMCLNKAQIENLRRFWTPWWEGNNTLIFDGLAVGSEVGYSFLFNGATTQFGIDFFQNAILNDSNWNYADIDWEAVKMADSINPGGIDARDVDLRAFQEGGGKVVQYHGWQDPVIPSMSSPRWYDEVVGFYEGIGRVSEVEGFYRLFMVPGMKHCNGGDGAWVVGASSQSGAMPAENSTSYSLLYSLIDWIENNSTGPQEMIGTKYVDDVDEEGVEFTRPYCRWPVIPVYDGVGNVSEAESWSCPTAGIY